MFTLCKQMHESGDSSIAVGSVHPKFETAKRMPMFTVLHAYVRHSLEIPITAMPMQPKPPTPGYSEAVCVSCSSVGTVGGCTFVLPLRTGRTTKDPSKRHEAPAQANGGTRAKAIAGKEDITLAHPTTS
jgi:hypothetical protein